MTRLTASELLIFANGNDFLKLNGWVDFCLIGARRRLDIEVQGGDRRDAFTYGTGVDALCPVSKACATNMVGPSVLCVGVFTYHRE